MGILNPRRNREVKEQVQYNGVQNASTKHAKAEFVIKHGPSLSFAARPSPKRVAPYPCPLLCPKTTWRRHTFTYPKVSTGRGGP